MAQSAIKGRENTGRFKGENSNLVGKIRAGLTDTIAMTAATQPNVLDLSRLVTVVSTAELRKGLPSMQKQLNVSIIEPRNLPDVRA